MEKNLNIANEILKDWICYIYHNSELPKSAINKFSSFKNAKLIEIDELIGHGVFWRFLPFFENENNICVSRDADSRITEREVSCIDEWLKSDKKFHIIKDHTQHYGVPIMAGMWGMKGKMSETILDNMKNFINSSDWYYGKDQDWLASLWESIKNDCLIHGIRETTWLKESRVEMKDPFNFIGNGWTENEKPIYHYDHGRTMN
jgi:hypothetical protein